MLNRFNILQTLKFNYNVNKIPLKRSDNESLKSGKPQIGMGYFAMNTD